MHWVFCKSVIEGFGLLHVSKVLKKSPYKSNGNVGETHTGGINCDKRYIIEQVTDFKYLRHCISEYKRDLEDKLQTYNKINGAIRRLLENKCTKKQR